MAIRKPCASLSCLVLSYLVLALTSTPCPSSSASLTHQQQQQGSPTATMFEIAMERTREMVARGAISNPADLFPLGSLLDTEPPHVDKASGGSGARRELDGGGDARWRSLGASISFNKGPSVASINSTQFRYASVGPLSYVDWRLTPYMTPITRQYDCQSCWAMAAVDSVAIMAAIINNTTAPTPLSTQQVCDCATSSCCQGGWPEDAYAYILANGNISSSAVYPYTMSDDDTCAWNTTYPASAKISGWEFVPAYDQTALMKAVTMQPVLVLIAADTQDFQFYNSFGQVKVYNGNCSTEINHAVLVVGYNLTGKYWIIKNTWPRTWGDAGYMYIAMQPGAGKCGMLTVSPMFPVYYPDAPQQTQVKKGSKFPLPVGGDGKWWMRWAASTTSGACSGINPCGGGTCYISNGLARCLCPSGFAELVGVPTSKCVTTTPCTALINPCGAGVCRDGKRDGTYACRCPLGYMVGSRADGGATCVPVTGKVASTYITQYGDTCLAIMTAYKIPASLFNNLNPYVTCTSGFVAGMVVSLNVTTAQACTSTYSVQEGDTCSSIATSMANTTAPSWSLFSGDTTTNASAALAALNPLLNCSSLYTSQVICVNGSAPPSSVGNANTAPAVAACAQSYVTRFNDSCGSVMSLYNLNSTFFGQLNPGLNCPANNGSLPIGIYLCVRSGDSMTDSSCSSFVSVQQGDSCPTLWNAWNLTQSVFLALNPGIRCQAPYLQVGQQVCVNSSLVAQMANQTVTYLTYKVQPNDTLAYIGSLFVYRCTKSSIAPANIAAQNLISINANLSTNSTIIIPCMPRIAASCGCTQSVPVCGADYQTYQSYCDAQCNYALPVFQGMDQCNDCYKACVGRAGFAPYPASACPTGTVCGYPVWNPPPADAAQVVGMITPACRFANTTCDNVCTSVATTLGGDLATRRGNYNTCYSNCYCCSRIPCGGPTCALPPSASLGNCTSSTDCVSGVCQKFTSQPPCQTCVQGKTLSCNAYCPAYPLGPTM